jgi:hypothetical protein
MRVVVEDGELTGDLGEWVESMRTYYEVWDDATGNRVGGAFETQAQAEGLLRDVLRINGLDAARDMAILAFHPSRDGRYEPR